MLLDCATYDDGILITVKNTRIDAAGAIQFKDQMREHTTDAAPRILLDLENVEFIDSSGLGAIVASMKQLAPGQVLELAGLKGAVEKVFHLTRLDGVFTIHPGSEGVLMGSGRTV